MAATRTSARGARAWVVGGGVALALGLAAPAMADQHERAPADDPAAASTGTPTVPGDATGTMSATGSSEHVAVSQPELDTRQPAAHDADRYPSLDVPTKPWAYDTSHFFALTRGLDEETEPGWGRGASMVGTVPLDVIGLPTAAIAGLFGT